MTTRQETLKALIDEVRRAGGVLSLRDGCATVTGNLPGPLLMRVHRARRNLSRMLG